MGVTGLWTVLHPAARPIKLETLSQKRLAIDASIWIYQFLKAVRDKEGNALRNSHVVGFFRRICKLLFLGIKPVFVFDGGAPALKRQTITGRKRRREGRREDAVRTAGKLLAVQMQRRAEEAEDKRRRDEQDRTSHPQAENEEPIPENLVYAEEVHLADSQRQQNRKFKKKDAYHLPELGASLSEMGQPNDPRIMSLEELQEYARHFDAGEDINVYDFSKIDFDSPFFLSLPASDRYNILNAARLRSRLRMGYSKDQLDTMFPDRMAFSKFQIDRVRERNELTQRLMNLNGMNGDALFGTNGTSRVAGEKGREYVLVKNDGVEGGWALGVVSSKDEGKREKPIDVERIDQHVEDDEEDWDDDEFEDVPIEGLNRLPTTSRPNQGAMDEALSKDLARRRALYRSRRGGRGAHPRRKRKTPSNQADSLFVADADGSDEEHGDATIAEQSRADVPEDESANTDEEELQRAIAMSLQQDVSDGSADSGKEDDGDHFMQTRVEEAQPFAKGRGLAIAHMANARSKKAAPKTPFAEDSDEEDNMNLQSALAEARKHKHAQQMADKASSSTVKESSRRTAAQLAPPASSLPNPFGGPLPFEKLDLGSSLLGKKKMQKLQEDASGGFEKPTKDTKKESKPLPPWFVGDVEKDVLTAMAEDKADKDQERALQEDEFAFAPKTSIRREETDIIDLEADNREIIDLDGDGDAEVSRSVGKQHFIIEDNDNMSEVVRMGDLAERVKVDPPLGVTKDKETTDPNFSPVEGDEERTSGSFGPHDHRAVREDTPKPPSSELGFSNHAPTVRNQDYSKSTSVGGAEEIANKSASPSSEDEEFEDVAIEAEAIDHQTNEATAEAGLQEIEIPASPKHEKTPSIPQVVDQSEELDIVVGPVPLSGLADQDAVLEIDNEQDEVYSDPEDEELFRQFAAEETEHARFASSFNNRSVQQNIADYERELKQLRNQQKKDRRDADEVTSTMVTECQHLLSLFGLPYVTAPMEAEAQCAELVRLGLVDGIVTDDSDIFLFGGTRVYKNMFNQAKFVECFLSSDLESEFGLSRERLIAIAQLLGSDYTEGLPGVGPVTAVELVSEFESLKAFKEWWDAVQTGKLPKSADTSSKFRHKFRKTQGVKLFLPPTFPDPRVELAYLEPEVDSDPSAFVWGVPDLNALRTFLMSTIGWSPERTDEILVPVIRDMNQRQQEGTQRNITAFYGGGVGAGAFAPRRKQETGSRRLESALAKLGQRTESNAEEVGTERSAGTHAKGQSASAVKATTDKDQRTKRRNSYVNDTPEDDTASKPKKKQRKARK